MFWQGCTAVVVHNQLIKVQIPVCSGKFLEILLTLVRPEQKTFLWMLSFQVSPT